MAYFIHLPDRLCDVGEEASHSREIITTTVRGHKPNTD